MKKDILTTFDFDNALFPNANYHNLILSELQKENYNEVLFPNANYHNLILSELQKGNYIKNCDFDKSLNLLTPLPQEKLNKDAIKWLDNLFIKKGFQL